MIKRISKNERFKVPQEKKSNKYLKLLKAESNLQSMKILEKYDNW